MGEADRQFYETFPKLTRGTFPQRVTTTTRERISAILSDGTRQWHEDMGRVFIARRCTDDQVILESVSSGREFAVSFEVYRTKFRPRSSSNG